MGYDGDNFADVFESSFGVPGLSVTSVVAFNDGFELEDSSGVILLEDGSYLLQET